MYAEARTALEYGETSCGQFDVLRARLAFIGEDYAGAVAYWKKTAGTLSQLILADYFRCLDACERIGDLNYFQLTADRLLKAQIELNERQARQLAIYLHRNEQSEKARTVLAALTTKEDLSTCLLYTSPSPRDS